MVCRENKARSAIIGVNKILTARHNGGRVEHDSLYQSQLHANGHTYAGSPDPSPQTYMAWLQGARQQIIDDPTISDAEKFRQSQRQPGLVTRLDQEIQRVRTGVDEHGKPLTKAQRNGGKHFAAMQRMAPTIARATQARDKYLETYARTTGTSVEQARARWDSLNSRDIDRTRERDPETGELSESTRPDLRQNTKISLTDNWRDSLKVAGMSSHEQADVMQDNRSRETLKIMEHERMAKVRTLPSRPSIRDEHRVPVITPEQARRTVQCDECGQFGHEGPACPNSSQLEKVRDTYQARLEARTELEKLENGQRDHALASLRARLNDEEPPGEYKGPTAEELKTAQSRVKRAERAYDKAWGEFEQARGPVPHVSEAVQGLAYNRDSGVLEVHRPDYERYRVDPQTGKRALDADGKPTVKKEKVAGEKYMYRMSNEEYDEMMASGSIGKYLGHTTGAKDDVNARYKFDNPTDAAEASVERRCPSCGQWASMTTSHQCPETAGSRSSTEEAHYRERQRVDREMRDLETLPLRADGGKRTKDVMRQAHSVQPDGTTLRFASPQDTIATRSQGFVARAPFVASHHDARVSGKAYSWRDPRTGQAYTTLRDVTCSCGQRGSCPHIDRAGDLLAAANRSQRVANATPGSPVLRSADAGTTKEATVAPDAPGRGGIRRMNYATIQKRRAENTAALQKDWRGGRSSTPENVVSAGREFAATPTYNDGAFRASAMQPQSWGEGNDQVSVERPTQAAGMRMERNLSERSGRDWVVRDNGDGTQTITAPTRRLDPQGHMTMEDRRELGSMLGMRTRADAAGAYIPDEPAWRHEFLDRTAGQEPTIRGGRLFARDEREMYRPTV